jgi:hypothetical protein
MLWSLGGYIIEEFLSKITHDEVNRTEPSLQLVFPGTGVTHEDQTYDDCIVFIVQAGNTKGGSITVPLTCCCLTGLD